MNYLDQLVGKGLDAWVIFQLIAYNMAWMVILAVPMGVLFATLMTFGSLSQAHEITIIKASGGSLFRMMLPVIMMGFIVSIALFWFNDQVLPESNHRAKALMSDIQRKKPTFALESGQFSTQLEGYTILARKVDSATGDLYGVTIYDFAKVLTKNIINADTGVIKFSPDYSKLVITLNQGEVHQLNTRNTGEYRVIDFNKYEILIGASGFSFEQSQEGMVSRGDREMNIDDMRGVVRESRHMGNKSRERSVNLINKNLDFLFGISSDTSKKETKELPGFAMKYPDLRKDSLLKKDTTPSAGYNRAAMRVSLLKSQIESDAMVIDGAEARVEQYEVEIYKKYSIPFACLVFVFVGCPLGIITRRGNFGVSAGISLLFYIFYWACLIGGEKFADRGYIDPAISMWLGNIVIGVVGLILSLKVSFETLGFLNPFKKSR